MPVSRYDVAVNSRTDGKFTLLHINGRPHILTDMVPIVGDSVMNQIMYPDAEVTNSMEQLDHLPAPSGHPTVDGENVSAFHPLATNAHNIGGFVRSPSKAGPEVHCQFCLDLEVAKASADGKELVRRIKANEKVGVSTGLTLELEAKKGKSKSDGLDFTAVAHNLKFDHVAVLLNEQAAGDHVGTELKLNTGEDADVLPELVEGGVFICNVTPADAEQADPIDEPEPATEADEPIATAGESEPVEQATQENETMDEMEAKAFLEAAGYTVTNDEGMKLIAVAEHDEFTEWKTAQETALNEKRAKLVDASDFTDEDVAVMGEGALDKLLTLNAAQPIVDNSLRGGGNADANATPELRNVISAGFGR